MTKRGPSIRPIVGAPVSERKKTDKPLTSRPRARSKVHQHEALMLRVAGASYPQIAKQIGMSVSTAFHLVRDALVELSERCMDLAEHVRHIEMMRLDQMLVPLWERAMKGDVAAVDRVLKIQERRAALLGLDAAVAAHIAKTDAEIHRPPPDGGPPDLSKCSAEDLAAIEEILVRVQTTGEQIPMPTANPDDPPPDPLVRH